jgi:phospholipase/lecithinase/hemolysin
VNFIPADINAVRVAIRDNQAAFGFQYVSTTPGQTACVDPGGVGNAFALLCANNPGAPSQFANPTADQTRLFADEEGHLSTAGQKIVADYIYGLVVAPAQISMLAENSVKIRSGLVAGIQGQIDVAWENKGPQPYNVWVTGDVSRLKIDSYHGFPDDQSSTPAMATLGLS